MPMENKRPKPTYSLSPSLSFLVGVSVLFCSVATIAEERLSEEIIVTATLRERTLADIAGTISVVSDEEMQSQLTDDLADITRYQPGLSMDTASRGGNEGFVIRGIGGNRVLTVIDGVRSSDIYAAGPSSYGKDSFEVDDLKAIEIIRGPASVLYGADAMGGAVLLRTKDASDYLTGNKSSHFAFRTSSNSVNEQLKTGFTWAGQLANVGSVLQATKRDFNEAEIKGPGSLNPQNGETSNWLWKANWQLSDSQSLRLALDHNKETIDTKLENELSSSVTRSVGKDTSTRQRISLSHDWRLDSIIADSIRTQLHNQKSEAEQYTEQTRTSYAFIDPSNPATYGGVTADRATDFDFNQDTSSAQLLLSKQFNAASTNHDLIYGLNYEITDTERPRNRCDTNLTTGETSCAIPSYPFAPAEVFPNKTFPDTETVRTGAFIQDEITLLSGALSIIPGIRYDRYQMNPQPDALLNGTGDIANYGGFSISDVDEREVSTTLGAIYSLGDHYSLFGQYAEGFRPPNFDESNQAFVNLGHGYATIPNPDLEAEYSTGIEIGLRSSFQDLNFTVAAYNNDYDNFIESAFVGSANGVSLFQDSNVGKANIYGAEATLQWQLNSNWRFQGSMAVSRGKDKTSDTSLDSVDPFTAVTGISYMPNDARWRLETTATFVAAKTRVSAQDRVQGEAYQLVDVTGQYQFSNNATLRFGIFNLLDEQYARWSSIRGLAANDVSNIEKAQGPGTNFRMALDIQL
ncbi:MAG: TonB-dependent hemoglobin/transferrin/lactoferrin family receptor [Pseudohongiellaceae bacterium]|nr:TonB-dependent hemoglobin/transferrin/lactoferrin family receptor [Pseudohongiellaceae bacterium]